jgi:transcriptional regulator with XRE-family HTH domain
MSESVQDAVRSVARNVASLRAARKLSLSELARTADISKSTLFKLERGEGNPSVETLWSLAVALEVPFGALFVDKEPPVVDLLRGDDAPVVGLEPRGDDAGCVMRHLLSRHPRGELELYALDFEPGARRDAGPHPPGVVEHVVGVAGVVDVGPAGDSAVLRPGDRITFPGDRPHHYHALEGRSRVLVVIDYP